MPYDPQEVGYDKLVDLFYSRHNSTTPNRAGNDVGTQYRSGIYYHTDEQKQVQPVFDIIFTMRTTFVKYL